MMRERERTTPRESIYIHADIFRLTSLRLIRMPARECLDEDGGGRIIKPWKKGR